MNNFIKNYLFTIYHLWNPFQQIHKKQVPTIQEDKAKQTK